MIVEERKRKKKKIEVDKKIKIFIKQMWSLFRGIFTKNKTAILNSNREIDIF